MDAALVVAAIIGIFFTIGLLVGVLVVIALPAFRRRRSGRSRPSDSGGRGVQQSPTDGWDYADPDDRPRWPGDGEDRYSGR